MSPQHALFLTVTCLALAACGGGGDDAKEKSAKAKQASASCEAGMTLSGDACVAALARPSTTQPLPTQ